jgi:hypothetical protein
MMTDHPIVACARGLAERVNAGWPCSQELVDARVLPVACSTEVRIAIARIFDGMVPDTAEARRVRAMIGKGLPI